MNFFKIISFLILTLFLSSHSFADSHDAEQNIIERAKEINQKVKEKQANTQSNIASEISNEEPLPLNDPFVGDSSLSGGSKILSASPEELENDMSLYKFKLVGVMSSENDKGFASLVDENGEVVNISLYEELSPGVKLIALNNREAVFERQENLMVINFKNQVIERAK
tara:strand:+ start:2720 stop:3223 length:504 start_codon:yes stop_codon:yes gene_type:complete